MSQSVDTPTPSLPPDPPPSLPLHGIVIDNYDSFTYNLVSLFHSLTTRPPHVILNNAIPLTTFIALYLTPSSPHHVDYIIISPGPGHPDNPRDTGICMDLLALYKRQSEYPHLVFPPVFGVCFGLQMLATMYKCNTILGHRPVHGELYSMIPSPKGVLFNEFSGRFGAIRYNSLVVEITDHCGLKQQVKDIQDTNNNHDGTHCSSPLLVSCVCYTKDTPQQVEIMGLDCPSLSIFTVQFHPESICTVDGDRIVRNFLRYVWEWKMKQPKQREKEEEECKDQREDAGVHTYLPSPFFSSPPIPDHSRLRGPPDKYDLVIEMLPFYIDSELVFKTLYRTPSSSLPVFWLDSSHVEHQRSRYSFMGDSRHVIEYALSSKRVDNDGEVHYLREGETFFDYLHEHMKNQYVDWYYYIDEKTNTHRATRKQSEMDTDKDTPPIPFIGGYVGYFSYEMKKESLPHTDQFTSSPSLSTSSSSTSVTTPATPSSCFLFADRLVGFDHQEKRVFLVNLHKGGPDSLWINDTKQKLTELYASTSSSSSSPSSPAITSSPLSLPPSSDYAIDFQWRDSPSSYSSLISQCFSYLQSGDSYELCLTNKLTASITQRDQKQQDEQDEGINGYSLYSILRRINPAPYSAFLQLVTPSLSICCCSPERFLRVDTSGNIEMKPIKGTRKRGQTPEEDEMLKVSLMTSGKDYSENLMIVDLIRNDLNKYTNNTSVTVPHLMKVESYRTVHQLVSTVTAHTDMTGDNTPVLLVKSCFPPGSMTGAPKVRSCEILEGLERGERGIYSGIIGYMSLYPYYNTDFNVCIRTAIVHSRGKAITLGAGGAIINTSNIEEEIEEVGIKAKVMIEGIKQAFKQWEQDKEHKKKDTSNFV